MIRLVLPARATAAFLFVACSISPAGAAPDIHGAIARAVNTLDVTIKEYPNHVRCFSCHHQGITSIGLSLAAKAGVPHARVSLQAAAEFTLADLKQDLAMYTKGDGQPGGVTRAGYALLALKCAGAKRGDVTEAVASFIAKRDAAEGYWRARSNRPPSEFSNFTDTFLAITALSTYGQAESPMVHQRLQAARNWLITAVPKETEDRVFRLLGLWSAGADTDAINAAAAAMKSDQLPSGCWRQLDTGDPDAYATATCLTALLITGQLTPSDSAAKRAIDYLLKSQLQDGTWHVVTRAHPVQPYFESGFPHGKDQFISVSTTGWAIAALSLAAGAKSPLSPVSLPALVASNRIHPREMRKARPTVWAFPPPLNNGAELWEMINKPELWQRTRNMIDGIGYADLNLNKQFSDEQLTSIFANLKKWHLKLCLETGAIKPWGITADATLAAERPLWNRFIKLGGTINSIDTDEPLCCTRSQLKTLYPDSYAIKQTALYYEAVRREYPHTLVGDTEPYPFLSVKEITDWLSRVQERLKADGMAGMDSFKLDVDWANFDPRTTSKPKGSWQDVREIEAFCKKEHIDFRLIYWAAVQPQLRHDGKATDGTWTQEVLHMVKDYKLAGGSPHTFVVESWLDDAPPAALPETNLDSFTGSVLRLCEGFVRGQ